MFEKHQISILCIAISTALIAMDKPISLSLCSSKKPPTYINWDNNESAFKKLTENNACILRTLVSREQRGKYCPDLYKARKPLELSLSSEYMHWSFQLDSNTRIFIRKVKDKYNKYNKLISILSYKAPHEFLEDLPLKCHNLLERNRYVANTYGSSKPYQDRIITPLHYVLTAYADKLLPDFCTLSFCNILLDAGANPNARDDVGNTPMHHASTPEQVRLLCEYGAKLNIRGEHGRTPLLNGIRLCNWPVVKCLLQYNANPNKKDDKGITPLTKAIAKKKPKIVRLLLECGADWTQEDGKNKGRLVGYTECLRVLRNHINTYIKNLLVKEFNLAAIHNIIHSTCMYIIETEMLYELMEWIEKNCTEQFQHSNSGAYALYEHLYEKRKNLLSSTGSGVRY